MRERGERGALDEGRRGEVFRHIRSAEKEYSGGGDNMGRRKPLARSVGLASIPQRGELDLDGNAFDGLPNNRLGTNAADARVVAPSSIGDGHINGRLGGGALSIPGLADFNPSNRGDQLDAKALDRQSFADFKTGLPNFSNFATNNQVEGRTTPAAVKDLIRKHVKPNSTKNL